MTICDFPFGFEDGHIMCYCAREGRLELEYEFWNGRLGTLVFKGYVGARDHGAVGAEVGSFSELDDSDLIESLVRRNYETRPSILDWKHFQFLGVDGTVVFEIVAPTCDVAMGTKPA
jgi:hypothetical protein